MKKKKKKKTCKEKLNFTLIMSFKVHFQQIEGKFEDF